jgi:hypothetical protein
MTFTIERSLNSVLALTDRSCMAVRMMLSRVPSWQRLADRATSTVSWRLSTIGPQFPFIQSDVPRTQPPKPSKLKAIWDIRNAISPQLSP